MKTTTAIIVLLMILVGGYFVIRMTDKADTTDGTDTTDEGRVRGPEDVSFVVGDTKEAAGLFVTLNAVVEDSRCPTDVTCVWAGRTTVNVTLESGEKTTTLELSSEEPVVFAGYEVSILSVSPEPISTVQIQESDYAVTLHVAPTATGENI